MPVVEIVKKVDVVKMTRKIPIISLEDFEAKAKKLTVMKSLVNNIAEGVKDNLESVNVVEIKNYNIIKLLVLN